MDDDIRKRFFPLCLPLGVSGHSLEEDEAKELIKSFNHRIFPPGFRQAIGLYDPPDDRQGDVEVLRELHHRVCPEWIIFKDKDGAPIGWFYGYMEDEETFFIDTIGFIPEYRGEGIYTAFLGQLVDILKEAGYDRIATTHHPNNRAALIADLKNGFIVVGMELHESHGPAVKMTRCIHEDRYQAFENIFSMDPKGKIGKPQTD